ncbi:MAG: hypothetical protein C0613_07045 [Desulfobulbaceae bacterium]|nr:MAG: hypothetical protein C0613_07045 [Desulfobulbaceae bacterium]
MAMIDDSFAASGSDALPPARRASVRLSCPWSGRFNLLLAGLVVACWLLSGSLSWAESGPGTTIPEQAAGQEKLWNEARAFAETDDMAKAALYFHHYWKTFPDSPRAAEALWRAASLYKDQALSAESPDWMRVMELFHAYIVDFPDSPRVSDAYFEVGNSYFYMGFFREARNYYTLFLQQYPEHDEIMQVRYLRGRALLHVGKFSRAREDFAILQRSKDRLYRLRGEAGQAYVHLFKGEWHDALGIFKRIINHNPDYYLVAPEILRDMGVASIRVGNVEEGRAQLLHYLNIGPRAQADNEAYFEVAESYLLQGLIDNARVFYELVVERSNPDDRYAILSTFRLAQYKAVNLDTMSEKQRLAFFKENGDKPFQEVLDRLYGDPLAQEARYSLLQRYLERRQWDLAYNLGKSYLRYEGPEKERDEVVDELGAILVARISKLLDEGRYDEVRALYEREYPTIAAYKKAELLMLIGQAYERETLYDQASVIYYRALGLEMDDQRKKELYFRRAEVYLANQDLKSAQRLLKYLRRLYQEEAAIAEVNWLSGRLRQQQERPEDALEFYKMAVESAGQGERRGVYADSYLRQLFSLGQLDRVADLVAMFHAGEWLPAEEIQYWYGRLGLGLAGQGRQAAAIAAYNRALTDALPEKSAEAQPIHLHLGDLLVNQRRYEEAVKHYRLAKDGQDDRLARMAEARLNENRIRETMADVDAML